jgi:predicted transcriptional regulator
MDGTNLTVADVMRVDSTVCRPSDPLDRVVSMMQDRNRRWLPVTGAAGDVIGTVTDRGACLAGVDRATNVGALSARDAMEGEPPTCRAEEPLSAVVVRMRERAVRGLVVVDARDRPTGLVTVEDLARGRGRDHSMIDHLGAILAAAAELGGCPPGGDRPSRREGQEAERRRSVGHRRATERGLGGSPSRHAGPHGARTSERPRTFPSRSGALTFKS